MDIKRLLAVGYLLIAISTLLLSPAGARTGQRETYAVPTTRTAPQIDGNLSDPCWTTAFKAGEFVRFTGGAPVVERTEAWVTTDGKTLFVAFRCHDSHPELIRASETQRGSGAVEGDDHVTVVIDSQNLRRGASSFSVNPLGTQVEHLEGGTADNITWSGDWRAASQRTEQGWTCELAIPFALLRHPARAKAFGLQLARSLTREGNQLVWPAIPPEGQSFSGRVQFLPEMRMGQAMPDTTPKPIFLPYALATASEKGSRARQGMDIKYPLSTTLTGLVALRPDFQTIEQDVASVNFSYNEQFVPDRRAFFAEGNEFLPIPDLFYSRRIGVFDEGVKVVGREGATSVGFVATERRTEEDRQSMALAVRRADGLFNEYGVYATSDNRQGQLSNRVMRASGTYGWVDGDRRNSLSGSRMQSWQGGVAKGGASDLTFQSRPAPGKLRYRVSRSLLSEDFISDLGLLRDRNRQGWSASVGVRNQLDRGRLLLYDSDNDYDRYDRLAGGGFFRESFSSNNSVQTRDGYSLFLGWDQERRFQDSLYYKDHLLSTGVGWNQRTLFQGGGLRIGRGRQGGLPAQNLGFSQGILVSKPFSLRLGYNQQKRDTTTRRQTIVTGTWRLDSLRAISGRLLSQNGTGNAANVGGQSGTNLYFAYSQRSRSGGPDIFLLVGDPNAASTQGQVTVKLVRPY